jgi:hypothetical protein
MPWTGRGVYVPVRAGAGVAAGAAGLAAFAAGFAAALAAAFLGAGAFFATGLCLAAAFFTVVPDFFFIFMGRTVPQWGRSVK